MTHRRERDFLIAEVDGLTKEHVENTHIAAPPTTTDAPVPGWLVGMLWTVAAWALYYYVLAV